MKAADLLTKDVADLEKELVSLRKEQFNLRMAMGSGQMVRPHLFRQARKNIARVKTVISQKRQQQSGDAS
jgi:large subunit ribosomal protein L29